LPGRSRSYWSEDYEEIEKLFNENKLKPFIENKFTLELSS
jgi:hypothetical protein